MFRFDIFCPIGEAPGRKPEFRVCRFRFPEPARVKRSSGFCGSRSSRPPRRRTTIWTSGICCSASGRRPTTTLLPPPFRRRPSRTDLNRLSCVYWASIEGEGDIQPFCSAQLFRPQDALVSIYSYFDIQKKSSL